MTERWMRSDWSGGFSFEHFSKAVTAAISKGRPLLQCTKDCGFLENPLISMFSGPKDGVLLAENAENKENTALQTPNLRVGAKEIVSATPLAAKKSSMPPNWSSCPNQTLDPMYAANATPATSRKHPALRDITNSAKVITSGIGLLESHPKVLSNRKRPLLSDRPDEEGRKSLDNRPLRKSKLRIRENLLSSDGSPMEDYFVVEKDKTINNGMTIEDLLALPDNELPEPECVSVPPNRTALLDDFCDLPDLITFSDGEPFQETPMAVRRSDLVGQMLDEFLIKADAFDWAYEKIVLPEDEKNRKIFNTFLTIYCCFRSKTFLF